MKILLCSHTGVFRGGSERSLLFLADDLVARQLNCVVSIPDNSQELLTVLKNRNLNYVTIYKDDDKRSIQNISFIDKQLKILKRLFFTYKMYQFIKSNNIDVVYLNTLRTTSEYLAAKIAGKKTVMHIRGFDTRSNFRYMLLFKLDRIITLNYSAKKTIYDKIKKFDKNNVSIIPNGVTVYPLENKKFDNKLIKIVFIGGYELRKGVDYFFQIANILLASNLNLQIIHIGDPKPKDDFSEKILNKYSTLCENENFIELGYLDKVTDVIDKFDIFLITSRSEGMPRTLLESMERGLIPIVTDIDELNNIIRDSYNGFIINTDNIEKCTNKIKRIVKSIGQLDYISKNTRNDVITKYNIENTNTKIIDALTKWN